MIYTIGYQSMTPLALAAQVQALDAVLIDVRSSPRSRMPGFGGRQLEAMLPPGAYRYAGDQLGGRKPVNPKAAAAIGAEFDGQDKPNCVLMCMEHLPVDCHRHHAICAPHLPNALHILDGALFTVAQMTAFDVAQGAEGSVPEPVGYAP